MMHIYSRKSQTAHREFRLINGVGMSLEKNYVHFDNQMQEKNFFEFLHCPFEGRDDMHP